MRYLIGKTDDGRKLVLSDWYQMKLFVNGKPAEEGDIFTIWGFERKLVRHVEEGMDHDDWGWTYNGYDSTYLQFIPVIPMAGVHSITIAASTWSNCENCFTILDLNGCCLYEEGENW